MSERFREWVCGLAWRVLWRWWPDRHFLTIVGDGLYGNLVLRETVRRSTAERWVLDGMSVREGLDHMGRRISIDAEVIDDVE